MTRSQMIETVARKTGFTEAQVETTMDAMFDQIADKSQDNTNPRGCMVLMSCSRYQPSDLVTIMIFSSASPSAGVVRAMKRGRICSATSMKS